MLSAGRLYSLSSRSSSSVLWRENERGNGIDDAWSTHRCACPPLGAHAAQLVQRAAELEGERVGGRGAEQQRDGGLSTGDIPSPSCSMEAFGGQVCAPGEGIADATSYYDLGSSAADRWMKAPLLPMASQ